MSTPATETSTHTPAASPGPSPWIFAAIIATGIALRLGLYLRNRALWLDEAFLALNIVRRDFHGLAQSLEFRQGAPLAYLWATKAFALLWGPHEYGLRAVPLIAGIAAFIGIYYLGRRVVDRASLLTALGICAVSFPLIRYASEVKQYSLDVLAAVAISYCGVLCVDRAARWQKFALLATVAAVSPWFSHASVFVIAGVLATLAVHSLIRKQTGRMLLLGLPSAVWGLSFAASFALVLRHTAEDDVVRSWWLSAYLPRPIVSPSALKWILWSVTDLFEDPVGLVLPGLGAIAFMIGALTLFKSRPVALALLLSPIGFAFLGAALQRYPFTGRFLLFAVPGIALVIGAGAVTLANLLWARSRAASVLFLLILFVQPALLAVNAVLDPPRAGMRPVIETLRTERADGEPLYVYHWAQFEFLYYAELMGYEPGEMQAGVTSRNDWSYYRGEIENFRGRGRVWFVFSSVEPKLGEGEEQYFLTTLDELGQRVEEHWWKDARLYCYALDGPASSETR